MENKELFTLGELFVADFLKPEESPRFPPVEMKLMLHKNGAVCLEKTAPPNSMWGEKYWYRSSINATMREQLENVVNSITDVFNCGYGGLWIDVASNDGFLLSCTPSHMVKVGIDPANDSFRLECEKYADLVIQDYFSADVFKNSKYGDKKARVITTISMFYDLSDPDKFLSDIHEVLEDNGLFVVQLSYTPLMLEQMAWDNVCHEHKFYYSLSNLKPLFEKNGFQILDCELNNTNAGSFRVYAMKSNANIQKFGSQTHREVCQFRINSLLSYERSLRLDKKDTWMSFFYRINEIKEHTIDFLQDVVAQGKTVMGYGASTKGATVTQYFGLNQYIDAIADRSHYKHGLKTVDGIPIISEDEMREKHPDYLIIFPFHFLQEFMEREREYLEKGGKMIILSPFFKVISK